MALYGEFRGESQGNTSGDQPAMGRPVIMIPTGVHKNNRLQLERTFNLSKGAIIMTTIRRQNLKRCDGNKPNIQDVPRAKRRNLGLSIIRTAPQLAKV